MAFRDKVRGPLGWILGVVGGLALLGGAFFAGLATGDNGVDQEQASVTEQQENRQQEENPEENQQDRDTDKDAESKPEKERGDGGHKMRGGGNEPQDDGQELQDGTTGEGTPDDRPAKDRHGDRDGRGHGDHHEDGGNGGDSTTEEQPAA